MCTAATEAACREEYGAFFEKTCRRCREEEGEKLRSADISPWTHHVVWLRRLRNAGFPFAANDLDLAEWEALGRAEEIVRRIEKKQELQLMMPRKMGL